MIDETCKPAETPWLRRVDFVYGAISATERSQFPRIGRSVTMRALRAVAERGSDKNMQCLVCCACGEKRVTMQGPTNLTYDESDGRLPARTEIDFVDRGYFQHFQRNCLGSLFNNVSGGSPKVSILLLL